MNKEDSLFDEFEEPGEKPSHNNFRWIFAVVIICGFLVTLWNVRNQIGLGNLFKSKPKGDSGIAGEQYLEYQDFAERFAVAAFNMSYQNLTDQVQRVSELMSDELLEYYKNEFLDTKFRQKFIERRAYVVFQKIDRARIEGTSGDHVVVRVTGENFFNSDVTGTQIQVPFAFDVVIKKVSGRLQVVNFKQRL